MGGTKACVFHNHRHCNFGRFGRGKRGIERVVALVFFQQLGVVLHVLAQAHGLRGTGLAGRGIGRARKHPGARAALVHRNQGVAHDLHVLGLVAQVLAWRLGHGAQLARHRIFHSLDEVGRVARAAVGQGGLGHGQLQHGEIVVTLANAQRDGFARKPALHLRPLVGVALPFGAGQGAAQFTVEINARGLPEGQGLHEIVDGVHAHLHGQRVKVGVAGELDGAVHVERAQAAFVAAEGAAAKVVVAGVAHDHAGRALVQLQRGQRHEGLVGGAGWVQTPQGAVEQGFVDGLVERGPVLHVDAFDKQVGVERGLAHQRQHFAVARVNGHQSASAVTKQVFHHFLQLDVQRDHHALAGCGRAAGQLAHGAPAGRCLHLLHAGDAVQGGFKALLHAQLADVLGAPVVGFVVCVLDALLLVLVDAADVANGVAANLAQGVVAEQTRLDLHAREAVLLRGKARHFLIGQPGTDGQRFEVARLLQQPLEAAAVALVDVHHLGELVNGFFERCGARRGDLQRVGRVVGGQHHAVAVQDQAPVGHDGHHGRAVALSLRRQVFVAHHLQKQQARHDQAERQEHHQPHHQHPQAQARGIGRHVANFGHGWRAPAWSRRTGATGAAPVHSPGHGSRGWPALAMVTGGGSRRGPGGGAGAPAAPS